MSFVQKWIRELTAPIAMLLILVAGMVETGFSATRARDLGIPFDGTPGKLNSITDVKGVGVGHATIILGEGDLKIGKGPVRTGVTAILPTGIKQRAVFAATGVLNGNGEMTGSHWVDEAGMLEEPILITNTHSVGTVHEAVIRWRAARGYYPEGEAWQWASLPVVAETWDGRLNDIHGFHVKREHVFEALDAAAKGGVVAEGNVGGGTGMVVHRFKGGIGTASRVLETGWTLGVLVQANYGLREELKVVGVPVGKEITNLMPEIHGITPKSEGNSIVVVVATDAPVLPHQMKRIVNRIGSGLSRVGGIGRNSSGDMFIGFTTAEVSPADDNGVSEVKMLANDQIDPLFVATVQAVEEAIINAMVAAQTMTGINGNKVYALPHDQLVKVLKKYKRLSSSDK
ncbi:P1 family peptidase [Verrucomicrobia bacterium]|nr:P1 family peptidase [Verrucomicrobiota bacterium]